MRYLHLPPKWSCISSFLRLFSTVHLSFFLKKNTAALIKVSILITCLGMLIPFIILHVFLAIGSWYHLEMRWRGVRCCNRNVMEPPVHCRRPSAAREETCKKKAPPPPPLKIKMKERNLPLAYTVVVRARQAPTWQLVFSLYFFTLRGGAYRPPSSPSLSLAYHSSKKKVHYPLISLT